MASWRGDYQRIQSAKASLVAISTDQVFSQRVFKASLGGLPYPLAADWMRTVSPQFGIYDEGKGIARRSTFVIDRDGKVAMANPAFQPGNREHYEEVLAAVERLAR